MIITFTVSSFGYAYAGCTSSPFRYGNLSGSPEAASQVETDGSVCVHQVRFNSATNDTASITVKPKNGDLKQINVYTYEYTPKKNYKGSDQYSLKFCGTERTGAAGCVTIDYSVTVK